MNKSSTDKKLFSETETDNGDGNIMKTIKDILGYNLHTSQMAFDHDGTEIVFINDLFIGVRKIYVNGELVVRKTSLVLGYFSESMFTHEGKQFLLIQRTTSCLTFAQKVQLYVDGKKTDEKTDGFYSALGWKQQLHAVLGPLLLGGIVGFTLSSIL